eukprot:COSAG02_NODE_9678_length_2146_cov_1.290181_2_plen_254_part_00
MHKARNTAQLQAAYQQTTGEIVQNWDDGKSVGKKEQARILRERNKEQQEKWHTLFRFMRWATFGLALTWFGLIYSWQIDGGVKFLLALGSLGMMYVLAAYIIRGHILWQKRPGRDGRYYYVGPPLFQDPPLLGLTTLITMHLVYLVANLLDGGAVPEAIAAGDQSLFQLSMLIAIPTVFAFVAVSVVAVIVPTYAAQESWIFKEQWKGEMAQYGTYVGAALLGTVYYLFKGMLAVWSSGYFSADYDPLRPKNL